MNDPTQRRHESSLDARLRQLDFGKPNPRLRQRTLHDVEQVLTSHHRPPLRGRRVLATAGALAVLCLLLLARTPTTETPIQQTRAAHASSLAQWLDLDPHVTRHMATRLANVRPTRPRSTQPPTHGSASHDPTLDIDRL